jgi:hypothetical protein
VSGTPEERWSSQTPESRGSWFCFLERRKKPASAARARSPTIETPIPMPILAPLLSPPELDAASGVDVALCTLFDVELGVGVGVEEVELDVLVGSGAGGGGPDLLKRLRRLWQVSSAVPSQNVRAYSSIIWTTPFATR